MKQAMRFKLAGPRDRLIVLGHVRVCAPVGLAAVGRPGFADVDVEPRQML